MTETSDETTARCRTCGRVAEYPCCVPVMTRAIDASPEWIEGQRVLQQLVAEDAQRMRPVLDEALDRLMNDMTEGDA